MRRGTPARAQQARTRESAAVAPVAIAARQVAGRSWSSLKNTSFLRATWAHSAFHTRQHARKALASANVDSRRPPRFSTPSGLCIDSKVHIPLHVCFHVGSFKLRRTFHRFCARSTDFVFSYIAIVIIESKTYSNLRARVKTATLHDRYHTARGKI